MLFSDCAAAMHTKRQECDHLATSELRDGCCRRLGIRTTPCGASHETACHVDGFTRPYHVRVSSAGGGAVLGMQYSGMGPTKMVYATTEKVSTTRSSASNPV